MNAHLDEERWKALLAGRLTSAEEARLTRHLDEDCDVCDAFLAERQEVDALDGTVDALLVEASPVAQTQARPDEVGFERFHRSAMAEPAGRGGLSRGRPGRRGRGVQSALGALGVVAAAVAVLVARPTGEPDSPPAFREKGVAPAAAPAIRLEGFLTREGGAPVPLGPGAEVPAGAAVAFRVVLERPACVHLWRDRPRVERLTDAPLCLEAGAHVLARDGEALGLRVDEPGAIAVWVVPEGREVEADTAAQLAAGAVPEGAAGISLQVGTAGR